MSFASSPAGKQPGIFVWRVENFEPKEYPKKDYGKFYTGDCYLVLHSVAKKPGSTSLDHTLYYWLGAESSQDERGAAALLTVELDDSATGGAAVQVREVNGFESAAFLALFSRIQFLKGGVASGFHKVDRDAHEPRLFRIKGSRVVTMAQVELSAASLNSGDVFVLDLKDTIYQWNGKSANRKEKSKAVDVCVSLRDEEHGGKARLAVLDEGAETDGFWAGLGGKGKVAAAKPDEEGAKAAQPKLFRCSDSTGSLKTTAVRYEGALPSKSALQSQDVFIVDCGSEVYVWVGRGTSAEEKKQAIGTVEAYMAQAGTPKGVSAQKVAEGAEPVAFKHKFADFFAPPAPPSFGTPRNSAVASAPSQRNSEEIATSMLAPAARPKQQAYDDGDGSVAVYRIVDFQREPVGEESFGQLYEGDSYIVHYSYEQRGKPVHLIYFWQGRESSQDEKGASALLTKELDDELGGAATQVRVEQGHETEHFLRIFKGRLVVRAGGHASGFRTVHAEQATDDDGVQLYQVKGYGKTSTYGAEVPSAAGSLNSGDCFVLVSPRYAAVWHGSGSNMSERAVAGDLAEMLAAGRPLVTLQEGSEDDTFWSLLGGKGEYAKVKVPMGAEAPPRLFECTNRTGAFEASEIFGFAQSDLLAEEIYLLDTLNTLFVWVGGQANETEREGALDLAKAYLAGAGRPKTPVIVVKEGAEPALFTSHFLGWDYDAPAPFVDPYEAKLAALSLQEDGGASARNSQPEWAKPKVASARSTPAKAAPSAQPAGDSAQPEWASGRVSLKPAPTKPADLDADKLLTSRQAGNYAPPGSVVIPLETLKANGDPRANPACKEQYLSDAEFKAAFGVAKSEFNAMKAWKQAELKKKAGLF